MNRPHRSTLTTWLGLILAVMIGGIIYLGSYTLSLATQTHQVAGQNQAELAQVRANTAGQLRIASDQERLNSEIGTLLKQAQGFSSGSPEKQAIVSEATRLANKGIAMAPTPANPVAAPIPGPIGPEGIPGTSPACLLTITQCVGPSGMPGAPGSPGSTGVTGPAGSSGSTGATGAPGSPGMSVTGAPGGTGTTGAQGPPPSSFVINGQTCSETAPGATTYACTPTPTTTTTTTTTTAPGAKP